MSQLRQTGSKDLFITCVAREKEVLKFWGLPRNAIDIVKTYENHFQKAASELEITSGFLSSNQLPLGVRCAVFSQIKRQWCRARVIDILGITEILIELMDYGNKETVTVDTIRNLDESFFRYPAQVVECILADVLPFNKREWSADSVRFCEEELLYQTVSCYAISEFMNVPIVRIAKKGENEPFVQRLINSALAVIKPESAKPQVHLQPAHPMQPVNSMQPVNRMQMQPVNRMQMQPVNPMQPVINQIQSFYGFKMNRLDQDTVHLVKISFIENVHNFCIQLAAAEAELKRLMDDIKVYTSSENLPFVNAPNVNVPCLAPFSSKQSYYRGIITSVSQGRCLVLFVDYGCTELKEFQELRAIPNRYLALQAQAIRCCLQTPIQIRNEEFYRIAKSGLLNCHVVGFNGEAYVVRLMEHVQEMVMQQPNMTQAVCSEPLNYPRQEMNVDSFYPVTVSYINDITEFYCQLTHFKEKLDNISSILNSGFADQDFIELSECVPGMPVCVKFSEDNVWYRAQVVKVNNEADIEVFFVDFGNYDNASVKDMRRMKPLLIGIPVMALKCRLFEVDSPSDSTSKDEMFDLFEELTTGQMLTASVKAVQDGQCYDIVLQEENASSTINQKLQSKFSTVGSVPVMSVEKLYVTSFVSPDSFFAQFEKLSSRKLEEMQNEINAHYTGAHNTTFKPKVGSYVCAKFNADQQFYRAKVEVISGASCQILFIDYGNRESVSFNDVHPINVKFIKEPQFGIDCSFESHPPATPVDKLKSLMVENLIEARMIKEQDKKWVIGLSEDFPGNVAILELLRQHETLVPRSIHGAGLRGFQENIPQREEYKELQNPKPDFAKQQRQNAFESRQDSISSSPKTDDEEYVRSFNIISVPQKAYRNVYVSHVVSPSEFYCQIEEESGKLQVLMKNIEDTYGNINNNELRLKNMTIDSPCCAVFQEDGQWYRGQIKQADSKSCTVYFIDYGNTDIVPISKVKQLDSKFFTLPSQAISCKSYNVSPKGNEWSDAAIEDFINMTLGKSFVAQFVESDSKNSYAVTLVSIGKLQEDVLNKEFVTLGHGHLKDSSKIIVLNSHAASSNLTFQAPAVKIGSLEPVIVTYGLNPGEIFVQLKAYESDFKKMMNNLQAYYSKVSDEAIVDRPHQGMICVAQFFMDSAWYRGEIKKVDKNLLTVSYIDYGNCETVDRKKIRCITQDFTLLPIQGIKCRLKDVKPPGSSWYTNQNINKYFEGQSECRFISKEGDCYLIDLFCNKKSVAEQLVTDGLAASDVPIEKQEKVTSQLQVQPLLKRESTFVSGQLIAVTVSYVHSPYKFWCQSADESDVLDQLMADIESQYLNCNIPCINVTDLRVGGNCMAKYSADDAWYRAEIKSKVSAEEFEVFFIDYGNSEVSTIDRLAGMNNPEFLKLPPQCFECRLPGASVNCDTKKIEEFQSIVDEAEEITAKVESITDDVYIVSLLYEKDSEELNISSVLFGEIVQIVGTALEDVPKFLPSDVPLGPQEGYVTIINTPHDFFIQLDGIEDSLTKQCIEVSEICEAMSADENLVRNPSIGYACAAKYSEDNSWYRAEIINIQETTADVLFVDYGNVSNVPVDTLKTLTQKLLNVPPYAIRCKLNGIASSAENWTQPAISAFEDMVTDLLLGVTFISKDIPATVNIAKDDKDVAQSLIELELAIVDTCPETEEAYADDHLVTVEDQLHSLPTDLSYPKRKLSSSKLSIKISYVDSCDKFFVMPLELSTELDTVMKTLEILYGSAADESENSRKDIPDALEDPSPSMPCVAKYSEDEAWYRAIITDISKNDIHVTFVDYGNSEITSLENLRPLTPELIKIPPIAIECKLYGIQANEGREQEISNKLEEYYMDEVELEIDIVNRKEVYEIKLFHNGDFADLLCNEGLAIEVSTTTEIIESLTESMNDNVTKNLKTAFVEISEDQSTIIPLLSLSLEEQVLVSVKFYAMEEKKIVLFATPSNLEDELLAMQEMLQTTYNDTERKVSQVKCNDFCAAKYLEDNNWYRAQVLSCTGDEILVKFIDYGNSEIVDINNINELLPEFTIKPQFSLTFCLTGFEVIEEMKQDVENKLDEQIYEELILVQLCKFTHKSPKVCITDIVCGEISLLEMLLNHKYLSQCYIESFEMCNKFDAIVKHVVEDLFYLLPAKLTKEQDRLRNDLQTVCCDISASSAEIDPAHLYAAEVNDLWSRVSISEIDSSSNSALVKAVDYGIEVNVQLSQLRALPIDLCHRPVLLVPCKIVNLEDAPSNIKNKELEKISRVIFQCEVQNQNSGSPLAVKLFDKSTDVVSDSEEQPDGHDLGADLNIPKSDDEFHSSQTEMKRLLSDKTPELDPEDQCLTDDSKFELKDKESAENLCDILNTDTQEQNLNEELPDEKLSDESVEDILNAETEQNSLTRSPEKIFKVSYEILSTDPELSKNQPSENLEENVHQTLNSDAQEIESELENSLVESKIDLMSVNCTKSVMSSTSFGYSDVDSYNIEVPASQNDSFQSNGDEFVESSKDLSDLNAELVSKDPVVKNITSDIELEDSGEELDEPPSAVYTLSESDASLKCVETALTTKNTYKSDDQDLSDSDVESVNKDPAKKILTSDIQLEGAGEELGEPPSALFSLSESDASIKYVESALTPKDTYQSEGSKDEVYETQDSEVEDASSKCVETALTTKNTYKSDDQDLSDSDVESVNKDPAKKIIRSDIQLEDAGEELGEPPCALFSLSESDASIKYVEAALTPKGTYQSEGGKDEVYETQDSEVEDNCEEVNDFITHEEERNELGHVSNPEGIQPVELNDSEKHTSLAMNENDWDERPECDIKQECKEGMEASESDSHPDSEQTSDSFNEVLDNKNNLVEDDFKTLQSDTEEIRTYDQSHSTLDGDNLIAADSYEQVPSNPEADFTPELSTDVIPKSVSGVESDLEVNSCQVTSCSDKELHNESSTYLEDPSLHRLSGKVDVYVRDVAISNGSVLLAVTPYQRYLELENRLHKEFQTVYSAKEPGISDSSKLCAVLCDDSWYRGKILQLGDELTVLLIDYGMCKTVPISDAKELTPIHKEIPAYAVWCTLTHLHCPTEKSNLTKEFLDSILASIQETGKIVSVEVIEEEEPYKVILFYEDDNLSYRLLTENLAAQQLTDIHIPTRQYSAKLSHVSQESDNLIYVNLVPYLDDIKTLNISMECSYPTKGSKSPVVQSDMYYAALHNGVWMRGKAISLEEKLLLRLIDTGETISINTDLCLLLPLHCLQPPFAIPCQIPDKITKSDKIAEELNKDEFLVSIENNSESQALCARIVDEKLIERIAHLGQSNSELQAAAED